MSNMKYKSGDKIICIINSRANLTVGKEYTVLDVHEHSPTSIDEVWEKYKNEITLVLYNDNGVPTWYDHFRFIPKSEFRNHIINKILEK